MKKILFIAVITMSVSISLNCFSINENEYVDIYNLYDNGIQEKRVYYNDKNYVRADILNDDYVYEFDILDKPNKIYENIGQVLTYSAIYGKKAKSVLIIEKKEDFKYLKLVLSVIREKKLDIFVDIMFLVDDYIIIKRGINIIFHELN